MTSQPPPDGRAHLLRLLIAFLVALVVPVALTGAALAPTHDHPRHHDRTWTVLVGNESPDHAIQGMRFLPKNIWVDSGDWVRWTANSAEIHTVTFLQTGQKLSDLQPFDPSKANETTRVGGRWYDGSSYYNSGVLTTAAGPLLGITTVKDYKLRFRTPGEYTYYCLVHGSMMTGTVHVQHRGAPYPYTQAQYDLQSAKAGAWILRNGYRLWHDTAEHATNHRVFDGNDNGIAMVMRFVRPTVYIRAGQWVTFSNIGMGAPHTITFGQEPLNPLPPSGDPRHYRGGDLNSGIQPPGATFTVRFLKPGTYSYICALHDYMGMVGKVVVAPRHHHHHHD